MAKEKKVDEETKEQLGTEEVSEVKEEKVAGTSSAPEESKEEKKEESEKDKETSDDNSSKDENKGEEEKTDKKSEELEDSKKTEDSTEEKKEEEKTDKVEEKKDESVSDDIKKTKEELSALTGIKNELTALYVKNKEVQAEKEQLSTEVIKLKDELKSTTEQLSKFKEAEKEIAVKRKQERLEQLSKKFKILGQDKTVEQLSEKADGELNELESVVDAAVDVVKDTKEAPDVTAPSQGEEKKEEEVIEEKPVEKTKETESLSRKTNDSFFKQICGTLTKEQVGYARNGKVTYL